MDKLLISLFLIVSILVILNFVKCLKPHLFYNIEQFATTEQPEDSATTEQPEDATTEQPEDSATTEQPDDATTEQPEDSATTEQPDDSCDEIIKTNDYRDLPNFNFKQNSKPCQDELYTTMNINNIYDLSNEYTLSFLFKINNENKDKKERVITIQNQLNVYIQNEVLHVSDHLNREHTVLSLKETTVPDSKDSKDSKDIEDLFDSELADESIPVYKHFAIISSYLDEEHTKMNISIFLNGIKGRFVIKKPTVFKYNNILFGTPSDSSIHYFSGSLMNPMFEPNAIEESILCSRWNSCGMFECSFREDEDKAETRNKCYDNCMKYSDCNDNSCNNKCYNEELSDWKIPCKFEPSGRTKKSCNNQCINMKGCRYDECDSICSNCDDINKCPWTKDTDAYNDDFMFDPKLLKCKSCVPPILSIKIPKNRELKINWSQPLKIRDNEYVKTSFNNYELDEDIDLFIFIISKKGKQNQGDQIVSYKVPNDLKDNIKLYNKEMDKTIPIHEYYIPNLDIEEYNIVCKSVKLHGGDCNTEHTNTTSSPSDGMAHTIGDSSHIYNIIPEVTHKYSK